MNELIEEELTKKIIGAAIEVHRSLGPGAIKTAGTSLARHRYGVLVETLRQ